MKTFLLSVGLLGITIFSGCAGRGPSRDIRVDGRFDDWTGVAPVYSDQIGDTEGIDIGRVWLSDTDKRFFVRFELGEEISLQSGNRLVLYLDTDDDPSTGEPVNGIGADLSWRFGERIGRLHAGGNDIPVNAYDLGLVTAPTVTSSQFEIEFAAPRGADIRSPLFPSDRIHWVLRDEGSASGDIAPDKGEVAVYTLEKAVPSPFPSVPLGRDDSGRIRIATYNALWDNIFRKREPLFRVLSAIDPDIIAFQEVGGYSEKEVRRILSGILGGSWYSARRKDVVTVSRYPIIAVLPIDGNLGTLIDLPDEVSVRDIFIINVHLPFGSDDAGRQAEAEAIIDLIAGATRNRDKSILPPGTPLVVTGDFNLVGAARQLETLLGRGEGAQGASPGNGPDWDGTDLTDLLPYHNGAPEAYTWRSGRRSGFGPGRLDLVIYTDSVLTPVKSYILCTETMETEEPSVYGLRRGDSSTLSDHCPTVVDFVFTATPAP